MTGIANAPGPTTAVATGFARDAVTARPRGVAGVIFATGPATALAASFAREAGTAWPRGVAGVILAPRPAAALAASFALEAGTTWPRGMAGVILAAGTTADLTARLALQARRTRISSLARFAGEGPRLALAGLSKWDSFVAVWAGLKRRTASARLRQRACHCSGGQRNRHKQETHAKTVQTEAVRFRFRDRGVCAHGASCKVWRVKATSTKPIHGHRPSACVVPGDISDRRTAGQRRRAR